MMRAKIQHYPPGLTAVMQPVLLRHCGERNMPD